LEYIAQCKSNRTHISDDPLSLRNLSSSVLQVLRDRWDAVQSVYELAVYESNRDIQRSDEFAEALQWNTCHPHVQALHLMIESNASKSHFTPFLFTFPTLIRFTILAKSCAACR
jgi:hypothetical protein